MSSSVLEAIFEHAKLTPTKLCLVDDDKEFTYHQFKNLILHFAAYFKSAGIQPNDKVLIEASQQVEFIAVEFALQLIKGIFVPIEKNTSPEKIKSFVSRIEPSLVVLGKTRNDTYSCKTLLLKDIFASFDASVDLSLDDYYVFPSKFDVSEILFTTGTTGTEKGIILCHDNNIALAQNVIHATHMQDDNVEFILSPFNHSHGLRRMYANLYKGTCVVMQDSIINIKKLFMKMDKYHVNSMDMVPSALSALLMLSGDLLSKYADCIRYIQLGAAPIPLKEKNLISSYLPSTLLLNMYGSTESGIACCYVLQGEKDKSGCIGKPSFNSNIVLLDDDMHEISGANTSGLLACKSKANMLGYYGESDVTEPESIIVSNDVAYFDDDGDIILLGRKDDVINIGGKKVSPKEIEDAALKFPAVKDCACVPVKDEMYGQVPKLFVQLRSDLKDFVELSNFLSQYLEPYKVPKLIERIDAIPRTYKGSIQRKLLM